MSALGDKLEQIKATLAAQYPTRVVTRSLKDFGDRKKADLQAGIYTLISFGEKGFPNFYKREAMFGRMSLLLVGQIVLAEDADPIAIEEAEFTMIEEIKAFVSNLPVGIDSLELKGYRQSGQIEHPYGWVAADLELMP